MTSTRSEFGGKVPRILVVDDTPDNLFLMNGLFEDRFRVQLAASGAEALRAVMADEPPDMVLLDIMMPDMDGYEVLRRIRQHPATASVPVIFLSALASQQDERLGRELGAVDYLTKPVDPEAVIRRVDDLVAQTALARRREALAEKLSPHLPPAEWRALFHGAAGAIEFDERTVTVVYAETTLLPAWGDRARESFCADVERLAARHGGTVDPYVWGASVIVFDDAHAAVRMAMELQRSARALQLRLGVHTGEALLAKFRSHGAWQFTLVGAQTGRAAQIAAAADAGGIVVSPQTWDLVHDEVDVDAAGRVRSADDEALANPAAVPATQDARAAFALR